MDYTPLTEARKELDDNSGLCALFRFIAIETWKRIEFAYERRDRALYETTITQNLVFAIQAFADHFPGLPIEVLESTDEKANGNDLELLLRFNDQGVEFYAPIQAKRISRQGRYESMEHGKQIESLMTYARKNHGFPLYLLYNGFSPIPPFIQGDYCLGCTLVSAKHLRDNFYRKRESRKRGRRVLKWKIPKFGDLHPIHAVQWHHLVCGILTARDLDLAFKSGKLAPLSPNGKRPRGFRDIQEEVEIKWREVTTFSVSKGQIDMEEIADSTQFSPKHRIVVTIN